mmetsp:Transcript_29479/g.59279  ORF Transcript_29479/g.59279 Transcript_29479/m.59279 type:complete len:208 (+) Transcript_29479:48-671(+)|eukprot:CAMPEP_0113429358 /NCGR_PEP_ID=MMETSP0013_2-20120614/32400_1 /TAXON_ID=2843 ORGANISM="Skeletonema costatum, Strain 1716" /NCGR_SAMPLE_ID=MMETSP0013_2 /ASSEMBLY_ACC=CAM_ASM_000158 /LENGTH=207 /DNA_ID=CAMNT_0000318061 /DNA_START=16 /DNA_END=639 /DNA_ORIENTATION=+ /assembly_acc=CAM_ASM_000158
MRFFAFVLSLQTLSINYCNGFTHSATATSTHRAVDGVSHPPSALKSVNINQQEDSANKVSANIAATTTLALGLWAMSASPSLASPLMNPTAPSSSSSSSFMVSAEYSSSDFTDFSLPSYKDALTAELNSNLKGEKNLFGEEASSASTSTSSSDAAPSAPAAAPAAAAPQKKEPTAAELKAEKAAAKAAQRAAREAQQAAIEAAVAAK